MAGAARSQRRIDELAIPSVGLPGAVAVDLIRSVCRLAGSLSLIDAVRADARAAGLLRAVIRHDTAVIVDWINGQLSHQGISDRVAADYQAQHGAPKYADIEGRLASRPSCGKLTSHWHFVDCGYRKSTRTCTEPEHFRSCPLPSHRLRNGRLNQTAYSLALFVRNIADGDIVSWIDRQLDEADDGMPDRANRMAAAILHPLGHVYGAADKILNTIFADLFIGVGHRKPTWFDVGVGMIAIDTLVHNFFVRTGVIASLGAPHPYGPACYGPAGCAATIDLLAEMIDARQFNSAFPANFPRFIQNAIWRYCAQSRLNICNGNNIDDRKQCTNKYCKLYSICKKNKVRA
jgi:hypothetical protein